MPSYLDLAVLGIVLVSALLSMMRGFTREVLAIASWALAAAAAYYFYPMLMPYLTPYIHKEVIAQAAAAAIVFFVTLIVVSLFTVRLSDLILDSKIGALDRSLGFVFGVARGFLLAVVAFAIFNWLVSEKQQPEWVKNARTRPVLAETANRIVALAADGRGPDDQRLDRVARQRGDERLGAEKRRCVAPEDGGRSIDRDPVAGAEKARFDGGREQRLGHGQAEARRLDQQERSLRSGPEAVMPTAPELTANAPDETGFDPDGDRLREECGVFGIFDHPNAAAITALGLHALQHRGQEAAGIVAFDGVRFHSERRQGLVGDHFSSAATIDRLPGR